MKKIKIGEREIGDHFPCFIVAEIGTNHNADLCVAKELITVAAAAGADAVKFQTYHWQDIVHPEIMAADYNYPSDKPWYRIIQERLTMPREWYPELFAEARKQGLIPFSTPHCMDCTKFLLELGVPVFKIASMELTNLPFLAELARLGKPVILSTGMGDLAEIGRAIQIMKRNGLEEIIITHCVSLYPPQPQEINLRNIVSLKQVTGLPVGFSDHSPGTATSIAGVALGACLIEKHITLDRQMKGPDHSFALEPADLKRLVAEIREVEQALGSYERKISPAEEAKKKIYRKSVVAARLIPAGKRIKEEDIIITRPGTGMTPDDLNKVVGLTTVTDFKQYEPLTWEKIKGEQLR